MEGQMIQQIAAPAKELPTALMGFRKKEVLSYIDQLLAANSQRQQELETNIAGLEAALSAEKQDKEKLLGKTKELCDRLEAQEKTSAQLAQQLDQAQQEAAGFKARLFTAEQEKSILRGEQSNLEKKMELLEQELETARHENQELTQTRQKLLEDRRQIEQLEADKQTLCSQVSSLNEKMRACEARRRESDENLARTQDQMEERMRQARCSADQIVAEANRAAVDLRADAEAQAACREKQMEDSAGQVAKSMEDLKLDLTAVERQMDEAYHSLRQAAERIEKAAGMAREKIPAEPVKSQEKIQEPLKADAPVHIKPAAPHHAPSAPSAPGAKSLSDMVLEKLARLLS